MKISVTSPDTYIKLSKIMEDPKLNIKEFCEVLSSDSNLASLVLKVVNKEFFGFPGQINNINRAANLLGIGQLYDMVTGVSEMASLEIAGNLAHLPVLGATTTEREWA